MHEIALSFLMGVSSLFGADKEPSKMLADWNVTKSWEPIGESFVLEADNSKITDLCRKSPKSSVIFPQVIHGVHELFLDNKLVLRSGDPKFNSASPFYAQSSISCADIGESFVLGWRVTSYSKFFGKIRSAPAIVDGVGKFTFLNVSTNLIAGGALVILAIFSMMIFSGRVSNALTYSVAFGSLISSVYFLNAVNSYVGINLSMINSHKIGDIALWIGAGLFLYAFRLDGLLKRDIFNFYAAASAVGIAIILLGRSGDEVQFGTMIPMLPCMIACCNIALNLIVGAIRQRSQRGHFLKFFSISLFASFGANDILHVTGVYDSYILLSVGIVFAVLGLSVAVNQEIENTYLERDSLLRTLEEKVAEKTQDLQTTVASLQGAQAELVQSAKLASLGTLSAGIAHEINNSINYVSGALVPLERRVMASATDADKVLFVKLFAAIKEGTTLTVEIVRSLRTFTGLNQASAKDVLVKDAFSSVLTILKSRLAGVAVSLTIEENLTLFGNLVGLNQMLMNLITNALDVLPSENPQLNLTARTEGETVIIEIADNGSGMSPEIQRKIFDPFFTTKEVGKGTGLGLHIVQKEIERHRGKITLWSAVGQGTKFTITLPKIAITEREAA